jgi:formamidopyrimidine-DNA glycosylase
MPEWPEMEHYRKLLNTRVCGRKIASVTVNRDKTVNEPPGQFEQALLRREILFVERRAKYLIFHLDDGNRLLLHLMLDGWMVYGDASARPDRTIQVQLGFADGRFLYFGGLRLGYLHRLTAKQVHEQLQSLGPDPFDPRLTPEQFHARLTKGRIRLKSALIAQDRIAGIGNCYSDEICFDAMLHPLTPVNTLERSETARLHASMTRVLNEALAHGGYMERPLDADDALTGGYQEMLRVYDREGEPCVRCGTPIEKGEVSSRKTYFCRRCQRPPS